MFHIYLYKADINFQLPIKISNLRKDSIGNFTQSSKFIIKNDIFYRWQDNEFETNIGQMYNSLNDFKRTKQRITTHCKPETFHNITQNLMSSICCNRLILINNSWSLSFKLSWLINNLTYTLLTLSAYCIQSSGKKKEIPTQCIDIKKNKLSNILLVHVYQYPRGMRGGGVKALINTHSPLIPFCNKLMHHLLRIHYLTYYLPLEICKFESQVEILTCMYSKFRISVFCLF